MAEYGYRYDDPDIGIFRSRLSPDEMRSADLVRATEAAAILNIYRDRSSYKDFLSIYTPVNDPFLHEARVHLYSRDHHLKKSLDAQNEPHVYERHLSVAWHENRFMETYFSNTLRASTYYWPERFRALAFRHLVKERPYESRVSRDLITRFTEGQVALFFIALILILSAAIWRLGKGYPSPGLDNK